MGARPAECRRRDGGTETTSEVGRVMRSMLEGFLGLDIGCVGASPVVSAGAEERGVDGDAVMDERVGLRIVRCWWAVCLDTWAPWTRSRTSRARRCWAMRWLGSVECSVIVSAILDSGMKVKRERYFATSVSEVRRRNCDWLSVWWVVRVLMGGDGCTHAVQIKRAGHGRIQPNSITSALTKLGTRTRGK